MRFVGVARLPGSGLMFGYPMGYCRLVGSAVSQGQIHSASHSCCWTILVIVRLACTAEWNVTTLGGLPDVLSAMQLNGHE